MLVFICWVIFIPLKHELEVKRRHRKLSFQSLSSFSLLYYFTLVFCSFPQTSNGNVRNVEGKFSEQNTLRFPVSNQFNRGCEGGFLTLWIWYEVLRLLIISLRTFFLSSSFEHLKCAMTGNINACLSLLPVSSFS